MVGVPEGRELSPLLSRAKWHDVLCKHGFRGLDLAVDDVDGPLQTSTFMISSTSPSVVHTFSHPVRILVGESSVDQCHNFVNAIRSTLEDHQVEVSLITWDLLEVSEKVIYLVVDDTNCPILSESTPANFKQIVRLLANAKHILWISGHAESDTQTCPEAGLVTGMARTAHAENQTLEMVTLDIQKSLGKPTPELITEIYQLLLRTFNRSPTDEPLREREYIFRDHRLLIPRVLPHDDLNDWISQSCAQVETMSIDQTLAKGIHECSSRFEEATDPSNSHQQKSKLEPDEVEIEVIACELHEENASLAWRTSQASSFLAGYAGYVRAIGSNVANVAINQRVVAFAPSSSGSPLRLDCHRATGIPDSIPFAVASSIPIVLMTAYRCLVAELGLEKGQSLLIPSATGVVERAILVVAMHLGVIVIATVDSIPEKDALVKDYGIEASNVIVQGSETIIEKVQEAFGKRGVNAVLQSSLSPPGEYVVGCATFGGTVLQIVHAGFTNATLAFAMPNRKNLTFKTFDLDAFASHQPQEASTLFAETMSLAYENLPIVDLLSISQEVKQTDNTDETAYLRGRNTHTLSEGSSRARIASSVHQQGKTLQLDAHGTYIVAGGLGDFGRRVSDLMVQSGARHILIISRREISIDEYQRSEERLRQIASDCRLYRKQCDIADGTEVNECTEWLSSSKMPFVKGIVHCAIVMDVRLLRQNPNGKLLTVHRTVQYQI